MWILWLVQFQHILDLNSYEMVYNVVACIQTSNVDISDPEGSGYMGCIGVYCVGRQTGGIASFYAEKSGTNWV